MPEIKELHSASTRTDMVVKVNFLIKMGVDQLKELTKLVSGLHRVSLWTWFYVARTRTIDRFSTSIRLLGHEVRRSLNICKH
jgi:hypothetical protein